MAIKEISCAMLVLSYVSINRIDRDEQCELMHRLHYA